MITDDKAPALDETLRKQTLFATQALADAADTLAGAAGPLLILGLRNAKAAERTADATERLANSIETITALFASCIGRGEATAPGGDSMDSWRSAPVNYFRASDTANKFKLEREDGDDE
ncbi:MULTISPECIES: hypothetical protein [unclassified Bradyrhizobium]|uniref:hypothetical protein n=1 Tax=unclassified Bradyrhizobium TaxID=2631580 RepID=UPI001029956E|nr:MULTISPECIES: hypothetical protein [unclassified Bradyrhizobium]RZN09482.1 hypothetical protein CWO90_47265 [Bradyrhizobium sp. Leo121]TAI59604.1 hypothetical protein CWO89_45395 [Bradyrhizobium sp. Leo170]